MNLGTPKDSSKTEVRKYLKTFLSDRRVIKIHPIIWKPILNGIILNIRPKKSAKLYQKICTENGFPLLEYTEKQMENLKNICPEVEVTIGMSYSEPSIETALDTLLSKEIEELNVIPMYPQYSGTTVGSVFDSVMNYFIKSDRIVDIKFIRSFYNNPQYIGYFSKKINEALNESPIDAIVFSYHGIPMSYVKDGDNYPEECTKTTKLIMDKLGDIPYYQTYQSKFGPSEWLKPATDDTLKKLPSKGIKNKNQMPRETKYTWKVKPKVNNVGKTTGIITITYPDGKTTNIEVSVYVDKTGEIKTSNMKVGDNKKL